MSDNEIAEKLDKLADAILAQTHAINMLAMALAEDDEEDFSPYQSLSEPPLNG